jgi:hypothetical protein
MYQLKIWRLGPRYGGVYLQYRPMERRPIVHCYSYSFYQKLGHRNRNPSSNLRMKCKIEYAPSAEMALNVCGIHSCGYDSVG